MWHSSTSSLSIMCSVFILTLLKATSSRMLKMHTAGSSSTLHLIDPLIAAMGQSNDTCYPTWHSVRWDHIQREIQRCCSKSLHVCCLMGLFQSDYWFGRKVREQPQPSQRIKHTGRIQVTIKHCHNSLEPVFSIVHLCNYWMLIRIMIIINQNHGMTLSPFMSE